MKLVRYGQPGKEKPGLIDAEGRLRDLSAVVKDISPELLNDKALAKLAKVKTDKLPLLRGKKRFGSPISYTSCSVTECTDILPPVPACFVTKNVPSGFASAGEPN